MDSQKQNELAKKLKALHVPGKPLLLCNVWDAGTAAVVAKLPATEAVATASWAIAALQGIEDNDMQLEENLLGIKFVTAGLRKAGKFETLPLSTDLQDGYQDVSTTVQDAIALGSVGANIEDVNNQAGKIKTVEEAVTTIRSALSAAEAAGVPDFVINARCDVLGFGGNIDDVITRGKAYLEAGATTVFVWGVGKWTIKPEEVTRMVEAFEGRLAVQPWGIGVEKLSELGVARISIGPALWRTHLNNLENEADKTSILRK